jgi:hypothetical protein
VKTAAFIGLAALFAFFCTGLMLFKESWFLAVVFAFEGLALTYVSHLLYEQAENEKRSDIR